MSLDGVRVALTASRERCEAISFLLEDEGAQLQHLPLLELLPPPDPRPFAAMVEQLQRHPWILLSSLEAVVALWEGARIAGTLDRMGKVGLIAADPNVAGMLVCLGQPARLLLTPGGVLELDADAEVLVPVGGGDDPWPTRLAQSGVLATGVLAWRSAPTELPALAPQLLVIDSPIAASALNRDHRPWLDGAVRVAGSAGTAEELSRVGAPAHAVASPEGASSAEALLQAAQSAWVK